MATSYLKRTPSSPGSNTTGTVSAWVKYDQGGDYNTIIGGNEGSSSTDRSLFSIGSDGTVYNQIVDGGSAYTQISDRLLRDPAAWYHVVFQFDTSNGVQADRVKTFINNEQITSWSTTASWPSSVDIKLWDSAASAEYMIGCRKSSSSYQYFFRGNMAHVHVVDGTVYAPSVFAETDSTSGIWIAKSSPSVTYGTNGGFYKFASGALGTDSAGSNNMTAVGDLISVKDSPDNNFATLNPLDTSIGTAPTITNGNLTTTTGDSWVGSTIPIQSGKWYWEVKVPSAGIECVTGVLLANNLNYSGTNWIGLSVAGVYGFAGISGNKITSGTAASYDSAISQNDIMMFAMDAAAGSLYVGVNGTWLQSSNPATSTSPMISSMGTDSMWIPFTTTSGTCINNFNFGNGYFGTTAVSSSESDDAGIGSFEYDVPASYYTLCTDNLGDQS